MGIESNRKAVDKLKDQKIRKLLTLIALNGERNTKDNIRRKDRWKTGYMFRSVQGWIHPANKWARFGSNPTQAPPEPGRPVNYFVYQDQGTQFIRPGHFLRDAMTKLEEQSKAWKL